MHTILVNNLHCLFILEKILKTINCITKMPPSTHTLQPSLPFEILGIKCFRVQMCPLLTLILPIIIYIYIIGGNRKPKLSWQSLFYLSRLMPWDYIFSHYFCLVHISICTSIHTSVHKSVCMSVFKHK